jgi:hypothetical protein
LELTIPPPTKEQLEKNRRDEERIKAERRKQKWDKKLAGLLPPPSLPPVAGGSGSSQAASGQACMVYDPATRTYSMNEPMKQSSQEAHNRPAKVSQVGLIDLTVLEGLDNEERRSKMDSLWVSVLI